MKAKSLIAAIWIHLALQASLEFALAQEPADLPSLPSSGQPAFGVPSLRDEDSVLVAPPSPLPGDSSVAPYEGTASGGGLSEPWTPSWETPESALSQAASGQETASAALAGCGPGGSGYPYNRCGCSSQYFPWFKGPGACDQWCVGPHWQVSVDGLIWRRENVDLDLFSAAVGAAPNLTDPMHYGPGARVTATGYNETGLGMRVVYEGINQFDAAASFGAAGGNRSIDYHSAVNSVEINFLRHDSSVWKLYGGFRYIELDEDVVDATILDKPIPLPANPPAASAAFADVTSAVLLENRLFGFQLGSLRDSWRLSRRVSVEGFCNGGVYLNDMRREDVDSTVVTVINGDNLATPGVNEFSQTTSSTHNALRRSFSDLAFAGEVGVSGVLRLNRCTAVRGGYQALIVDGVGEGIDAFFASGFNSGSVLFHGLQVGLEYRR